MKILSKITLFAVIMTIFSSTNVISNEIQIPSQNRDKLDLTIYNNDLSLVTDSRNIKIDTGINNIAFEDISSEILPETAIIKIKNASILEQNFDYQLITYKNLLNKNIGKTVITITTNPSNGKNIKEEATLISANPNIILQFKDRIEANFSGRIAFTNISNELTTKPTLFVKLDNLTNNSKNMKLSYLSNGISWKTNYVADLDEINSILDLNSWISITNHSGTDFNNANIQLVAGNINKTRSTSRQPELMMMDGVAEAGFSANRMMVKSASSSISQENFADYHIYTIPRRIDIKDKQNKQISLFTKKDIKFDKKYIITSPLGSYYRSNGDFEKRNPEIEITFKNNINSLNAPLPKGVVRFYKNNKFIGENNITNTPINEEIKLTIGKAFDIFVDGKITDSKKISKNIFENSYEITFNNSKNSPAKIEFTQNVYGTNWEILKENITSKKEKSNTIKWELEIPAKTKKKLEYQIRVTN